MTLTRLTKNITVIDLLLEFPELKAHLDRGDLDVTTFETHREVRIREGPWSFQEFCSMWDKLIGLNIECYWF